MKNSTSLILVCCLVLISGYNATEVTSKPEPTVSPAVVTKASTTAAPVTTDQTTKIPTTIAPTVTPNVTTTAAPKTTTDTPTTKPTPTPTPPPTTTSAAPPTTSAPTPVPDPQTATWNVSDKDNIIIARMAVQLSITYNVTDEKVKNKTVLVDIPANNQTMASGIFTSNLQAMKLSWKSAAGVGDNSISLVFKSSNSTKMYWLSRLEVNIQAEDLPNIDPSMPLKVFHNQGHFNTSLGNSYRCVKLQTFNLMKENDTQIIGQLKVTDLQFQAFKAGHDTTFGLAEDCAFDTPDIVPIAVGCVLAGLVVIILVGYLITRRRSQLRGYLSM